MDNKISHIETANKLLSSFSNEKVLLKITAEHYDCIEKLEEERNESLMGLLNYFRLNKK